MTNEKDLREDDSFEVVATSGPAEAQMIEEMLKNNGIDCMLQGSGPSTPWPTQSDLDEVRVLVSRTDRERAEELVEAFFTPVGKDELEKDELEEGGLDLGVDNPDEPSGLKI